MTHRRARASTRGLMRPRVGREPVGASDRPLCGTLGRAHADITGRRGQGRYAWAPSAVFAPPARGVRPHGDRAASPFGAPGEPPDAWGRSECRGELLEPGGPAPRLARALAAGPDSARTSSEVGAPRMSPWSQTATTDRQRQVRRMTKRTFARPAVGPVRPGGRHWRQVVAAAGCPRRSRTPPGRLRRLSDRPDSRACTMAAGDAERIFTGIAASYDRVATILSLGQDPRGRRAAVDAIDARPPTAS